MIDYNRMSCPYILGKRNNIFNNIFNNFDICDAMSRDKYLFGILLKSLKPSDGANASLSRNLAPSEISNIKLFLLIPVYYNI